MSNPKGHADLLFEQYLLSQGMCDFEYEKDWKGIMVHPDYFVFHKDSSYIFEVKELDVRPRVIDFAFGDPYITIRSKIHEVVKRKQFKPFKDKFSCCLVLWSSDDPRQLLDPIKMGGAMYGNVGFSVYLDPKTGKSPDEESEIVFNKHGKMIRPGEKEHQNTTFSALISLSAYPKGRLWEKLKDQLDSSELGRMNLF